MKGVLILGGVVVAAGLFLAWCLCRMASICEEEAER